MKIKIDKENKAIIAEGWCRGKRIKAVAVCREPHFDEEFGVKLAKMKYKIKEKQAKLKWHESVLVECRRLQKTINSMITNHNNCAENIDISIQNAVLDCEKFVNNYLESVKE